MTIGSSFSKDSYPKSLVPFENMLNGKLPFIADFNFYYVDVEDVALAHILAMENSKANGRYIIYTQTRTLKQIQKVLFEKY